MMMVSDARALAGGAAQTAALRGLLGLLPAHESEAQREAAALSLAVHFRHLRGARQSEHVRAALRALTQMERYSRSLQRYPLVKQAFWEQVLGSDLMFGGHVQRRWALQLQHEQFPRLVLDFSRMNLTAELVAEIASFLKSVQKENSALKPVFSGVQSACDASTRAVGVALRFVRCRLTATEIELLRLLLSLPSTGAAPTAAHKAAGVCYYVSSLDLSENALNAEEMIALAGILTDANAQQGRLAGQDVVGGLEELVLEKVLARSLTTESWTAFRALVNAAFGVGTGSRAALRRLSLAENGLSYHHVACLCSALRCRSTSLEELSLAHALSLIDPSDREACWQWLALGLRPRTGTSSALRRLDLSGNPLFPQDMGAWFQSLRDPLGSIVRRFEAPEERERQIQNGISTCCSFHHDVELYSSPTKDSPRLRIIEQEVQTFVDTAELGARRNEWETLGSVGDSSSSWLCVVVPGFGVVWTLTKHVALTDQRESGDVQSTAVLSHLVLNDMGMSPESKQTLWRFLATFDGQLRSLELRHNALSAIDMQTVLGVCDQLEHLDVEGCRLLHMQPLVDALTGELGQHLLRLNLNGNLVGAEATSQLAVALAGESPARLPALQELYLANNLIGANGVRNLHSALEANKTLELLELDVPNDAVHQDDGVEPEPDDDEFVQLYRTRCMRLDVAFQNELLGTSPLALERKLAFLLILAAKGVVLERGVVALIFSLAGNERRRRILWNPAS